MGARRIDPRRRSVLLAVEPLEDRFLLSAAVSSSVGACAAPAPPNPVAGQQRVQSQPSPPNDSAAQQTTSGPSAPVPAVKAAQEETGLVLKGESGGTSGGAQAVSTPVAGTPPPTSNSVTGEKGSWQALYSAASPHAAIDPYARGRDDDDDSPTMEYEEAHLPSHQASFEQYHSTIAVIAVLHDGASAGPGGTTIQVGSPHSTLDLLSAAGLGTVGLARAATILPATTASLETGWGHGHAEGNEGREKPQAPQGQPLIIPPLAGEEEDPPLVSSPGGPFANLLPMDVEAIQRSADAFFEQLARLSEEWHDSGVIEKLTPWLVAASVVAYKWVRLRRKRGFSPPGSEDNWEAGPAVLLAGDEG
jgi:hypothetical protein